MSNTDSADNVDNADNADNADNLVIAIPLYFVPTH